MFGLIEGIFSFIFGMIEMAFGLAWGAVELVFGLLGGIFSLLTSLGGAILAGALVVLAVNRRKARRNQQGHPYAETAEEDPAANAEAADEDAFDSFYDQYRTQQD